MKQNTQTIENLAVLLRALGHPVRLEILRIMADNCKNNCCCTDVTKCFDLAQSTVSQHIKVLLEAGLVTKKTKGTRNCYLVCSKKLQELQELYDDYLISINKEIQRDENSD